MILLIRSLVYIIWIICNSAIMNFYQFLFYVLVRPFNQPLYRRVIAELVQSPWISMMSTVFPETCLHVTGEVPSDPTKPAIIIANHQVDADWWFIWQVAQIHQGAGYIKIVLKNQLKYIPIIGWGMRMMDFLFLRRSLEQDRNHIRDHMMGFVKDHFPFWMVIFPEGTTIYKEAIVKSKSFSEKTNRPVFERLLLPRVSGFEIVLNSVSNMEPDIYDLTIGYPSYSGEIPTYEMGYNRSIDKDIPTMKKLLAGVGCRKVHIHGEKFKYSDVKNNAQEFLDNRWKAKEKLLEEYSTKNNFESQNRTLRLYSPKSSVFSVVRLWSSFFIFFLFLPVIMIIFFPCYSFWVLWTVANAIYDRGTSSAWWPYFENLLKENKQMLRKSSSALNGRIKTQLGMSSDTLKSD